MLDSANVRRSFNKNPVYPFGHCRLGLRQIRLSPGINLGTPLTDTLISSSSSSVNGSSTSYFRYNSVTKRLLVGPSLRLELPRGLGLEFDALYQRVNFDDANGSQTPGVYSNQSFEQATANRWQFPLLVQYSRSVGKISPFVEFGPSISAMLEGNSKSTSTTLTPPSSSSTTSGTSALPASTTAGVTAGGGVAIPAFSHHLSVEVRFSHWFSTSGSGYPAALERSGDFSANLLEIAIPNVFPFPVSSGLQQHANEASFLLGFSF
ncbi:MAG TPA: outer membrane beta-barrel protein [Bryobacteraceae bacterium]|nr:outer membrane beta-barrel protein [Bryobacteraceae bacterium]